jgi:peptide/nickel transport system substrate-binding protein
MSESYWTRQLTRRRALRGAALGSGAAALILAGCGGGDGGSGTSTKKQGLFSDPEDTTKQAKRGGTYAHFNANDETNLDPFTTPRGAGQGGFERPGYQKLLREKEFAGGSKSQVFEGDAAESYELSDGGLKLVAKLRPNNKFDPRPPTNGRVLNAQDVVYSWNKLVSSSTYASVLAYAKDPAVPIESVTATDDRTVVYKMAFPWAALLAGIADGGPHQIGPVEAEDKFNPKNTIRGSGPWMLDYEPSVAFRWRRNPGYFESDYPYLDGYDQPILPEYATRLAQFRAKRIYDLEPTNPADIPQSVSDSPEVKVYKQEVGINHIHMWFSGRPNNPFRDVRLRRAASMALDRQLYADVISEAEKLRAFGLPPEIVINNNIPGGAPDYRLDPFGKEMGEAAQYFKFNQAEAKKLMSAAGYTGAELLARVSTQAHATGKESEIALQMLREVGFRVRQEPADYNTVFLPNILSARGDWDGNISFSGGGMGFSPATGLQRVHHPAGGTTRVSWQGQPWDEGHKKIADMIEKALREVDTERYRSQIYDLQREIGMYQSAVIIDFQAGPFRLVWPWVKNYNVYRLARGRAASDHARLSHVWIDDKLKT